MIMRKMIIHDHTSLTAVSAHPALKIFLCYDGSHIGCHSLGVIWQSRGFGLCKNVEQVEMKD